MAIDPKININENQVIFKRDTGHAHDGLTSSLIDASKYSMFDFVPYPISSPGSTRRNFQENNLLTFKSMVVAAVEERVLNPRGIRIQANAITANEIAANTITANEFAANIVLVNNIIKSNNYAAGSTGWAINGNGAAEFSGVTVRGTVVANAGSFGGILIAGSSIYSSDYDSLNGFAIYSNGFADFNEVSVRGEIIATSGSIADNFTIGNNVTIGSSINIGNSATIGGFANIGANISIGDNATIGGSLRIGDNVRINNATGDNGATVFKVRGQGTSTTKWIAKFQDGANTPSDILNIRDDGRVAIDGSLYVNGSQVTGSDLRLKTKIFKDVYSLDIIKQLKPTYYVWKNSGKEQYGFIAQELYETIPNIVLKGDSAEPVYREDGRVVLEDPWGIEMQSIVPYLVKALQELSEKVDSLETRLRAIEGV